MLSIIVATARRNVIGNANRLPWYLSADLRHFREITTGHTVVMGRKTFDSIITRLGHPLPNRKNIVLTRDPTFTYKNVIVVHEFSNIVKIASNQEVFVIGGAEVYAVALPYAKKIYLTEVDTDVQGDTYFPQLEKNTWRETSREAHHKDEKNTYDYSFVTLVHK